MDSIEQHYFNLYVDMLQRQAVESELKVCPSCLESFRKLTTLESCKHEFCEQCVKEHLKSRVASGCRRIEDFFCLIEGCNTAVSEVELEKWLDFEYFSKLTNKVLFELDFLCTKCRQRSQFKSNEELVCQGCYTVFCKFCKAEDHDGRCNTSTLYFKEVRASIEDEEIGYCPQCNCPFMKDENCDHVTCQNPDCGLEFCFYCWVPFDSINWHGSMYHRQDCRNFEDYGEDVNFYDECPSCLKIREAEGEDRVCDKPTKTRVEFLEDLLQLVQN
jgi:hypothetical protein